SRNGSARRSAKAWSPRSGRFRNDTDRWPSSWPLETLDAREQEVMLVHRAADHREPHLLLDLVAHLGQPRARDEERDLHLRRLDHHLRGEPAGGVEDLVSA